MIKVSLVFIACLTGVVSALAQPTQVSTLDSSRYSSTYVFQDEYDDQARGFLFTTDNQSYTLNSIQVSMHAFRGGPLTGYLTAWDGLTPSYSMPVAFDHTGVSTSSFSSVTFTPTVEFTLDPNATYAFKLTADSPGYFEWGYIEDSAGFTTPDGNPWVMNPGILSSGNGGSSWELVLAEDFRMQAAVQATSLSAIPEPSTYALTAGFAMLAVTLVTRRKNSRFNQRSMANEKVSR